MGTNKCTHPISPSPTRSIDDTVVVHGPTMDSSLTVTTKKVVSFELAQTRYFGEFCSTAEELKSKWYTEIELQESREEARMCVVALHAAEGKLDRVNSSQFCLRGIEKFANVPAKAKARRLLITSVLGQQQQRKQLSREDSQPTLGSEEELAALSRYLTQPSRDLAYSFGLLNASKVLQQQEKDDDDDNQDKESDSSVFSTRHEKNERDAASALLCMSPASLPTATHDVPVAQTFHPTHSRSAFDSSDELRPSPSKRPRVRLTEEATLARQVPIHQ